MRTTTWIVAMMASFLLCPSAPTRAAVILVGGSEGTEDPPEPTEGATTEEDWNPVVTCNVTTPGSIDELLDCLEDEIATPPPPCPVVETETYPGGPTQWVVLWFPGYECSDPQTRQDFIVTRVPYPRYGVTIRRLDGTEISRIALREDDPGIQTTEVSIDQPDRVGRLRQIEQSPHGGLVELIINGTVIRVTFLPSTPPSAINTALIQQARAYGFDVTNVTPYLYVRNLNHSPYGIRRLRWRSTDTGITRSDLGLYPEGDPAIALP